MATKNTQIWCNTAGNPSGKELKRPHPPPAITPRIKPKDNKAKDIASFPGTKSLTPIVPINAPEKIPNTVDTKVPTNGPYNIPRINPDAVVMHRIKNIKK